MCWNILIFCIFIKQKVQDLAHLPDKDTQKMCNGQNVMNINAWV